MDWSDADADLDASEHATRPRMDMRLERHSVVRFQRYWAEDGDVDLQARCSGYLHCARTLTRDAADPCDRRWSAAHRAGPL
jgi:hypothetical protein